MAGPDQKNKFVTFRIPQPLVRRVVASGAIVMSGIFLIFGLILSFKAIAALWIALIACAGLVLFWWLAFPSRESTARLEISREAIRYLPGRVERRLTEPPFVSDLSKHTQEIILCHSFFQELPDGFRLIVKSTNGAENEFRSSSLDYLTAKESGQLAEVITTATGLPVRLLKRHHLANGTVQESRWSPSRQGARVRLALVLLNAALPFAAGAVAGYIFPANVTVLAIGLALWIFQAALLVTKNTEKRSIVQVAASAATTLVISGSAYALAYVLTAHLMSHF